MKRIVCPECGNQAVRHFTDAFLVWTPILRDDGALGHLDSTTEEYAEYFECSDCGHRPTESELVLYATLMATN
jgi:DNA-directed RNA polymerase subunit RPC12/RpoP